MENRTARVRKNGTVGIIPKRNVGRPPVDWSDEELHVLGAEMLQFFISNPHCYLMQDFILKTKHPTEISMKEYYYLGNDRKVFSKYYDHCKAICGKRQIDLCGKINGLHPTIVNRFLNTYFGDVKATEREMKTNSVNEIVDAVEIISYKRQKNNETKTSS